MLYANANLRQQSDYCIKEMAVFFYMFYHAFRCHEANGITSGGYF